MRKLIAGPTVFICDECVELYGYHRRGNKSSLVKSRDGIPTPKEIRKVLTTMLIGQDHAKKVPGRAHHYKCALIIRPSTKDAELAKSNILPSAGPARARRCWRKRWRASSMPFTMADATTLTEAGYVGEDVGHHPRCSRPITMPSGPAASSTSTRSTRSAASPTTLRSPRCVGRGRTTGVCSRSWKAPSPGAAQGGRNPQQDSAGRHHQHPVRVRRCLPAREDHLRARRSAPIGFSAKVLAPRTARLAKSSVRSSRRTF